MKKQSIVLLITLSFITAISLIMLKNLNDSEKFIKEVSFTSDLAQIKIAHSNIQDEIIKYLNKNKDKSDIIDGIIEIVEMGIPLEYGDLSVTFNLDDFAPLDCYLNDIKTVEQLTTKCGEEMVDNITYPYEFIDKLKKYKPFSSKYQIDYFLDDYIQDTKDDKIYLVKNDFEFLKIDSNSSFRYLECNYDISLENIESSGKFIFKLGETTPLYSEYFLDK